MDLVVNSLIDVGTIAELKNVLAMEIVLVKMDLLILAIVIQVGQESVVNFPTNHQKRVENVRWIVGITDIVYVMTEEMEEEVVTVFVMIRLGADHVVISQVLDNHHVVTDTDVTNRIVAEYVQYHHQEEYVYAQIRCSKQDLVAKQLSHVVMGCVQNY